MALGARVDLMSAVLKLCAEVVRLPDDDGRWRRYVKAAKDERDELRRELVGLRDDRERLRAENDRWRARIKKLEETLDRVREVVR